MTINSTNPVIYICGLCEITPRTNSAELAKASSPAAIISKLRLEYILPEVLCAHLKIKMPITTNMPPIRSSLRKLTKKGGQKK